MRRNSVGGCDFPARPDLSAQSQTVLWAPAANPAVLTLVAVPQFLSPGRPPPLEGSGEYRESPEGRHALHDSPAATQLILRPGAKPGSAIAALIPLDADALGRIEALIRFWRSWQRQTVPLDTRVTAQRRARLRLMLRAVDGSTAASYREIANAIYGERRVASEPWKTSPLRDTVIGLVKGGRSMIAGGYLQLLRHRRRL